MQQPPERLDIFIVVSDIRIFCVDPVSHLVGKVFPFLGVFHHLASASHVVVVDRDFLADVLLGDAERLLHSELHGQTVSVPSSLALHMETLHRLVAAEQILYGACHHVVDARHTVCRRRTLIKHKRRMSLADFHTFRKNLFCVPFFQNLLIDVGEVESIIFLKFILH